MARPSSGPSGCRAALPRCRAAECSPACSMTALTRLAFRPWECASHSRWLRADRLGCSAAASSSDPTRVSGRCSVWYGRPRPARRARRPCPGRGSPASWWTCPRRWADEPGDLLGMHGERHPVQGDGWPEPLGQLVDFNGRVEHATVLSRFVVCSHNGLYGTAGVGTVPAADTGLTPVTWHCLAQVT